MFADSVRPPTGIKPRIIGIRRRMISIPPRTTGLP